MPAGHPSPDHSWYDRYFDRKYGISDQRLLIAWDMTYLYDNSGLITAACSNIKVSVDIVDYYGLLELEIGTHIVELTWIN